MNKLSDGVSPISMSPSLLDDEPVSTNTEEIQKRHRDLFEPTPDFFELTVFAYGDGK